MRASGPNEANRDEKRATQDRLVEENIGLVHHIARQLARSLSTAAELDDLVSAGTVGLIEALEKFDPSRGLAFSTFAAPRIRGAIMDDLRRQDHVPRSVRRKARNLGAARTALRRDLDREPSDAETAAHLGIDTATYWRWQEDAEGAVRVSLDRPVSNLDPGGASVADTIPETSDRGVEDLLNLTQEVEHLRGAILGLKSQERIVLSLYYFEELKLHEIGEVLELTESRVSQIRSKAISNLRAVMAPLRENVVQ